MLLTEQTITCGGNPYPQLETSPQLHEGKQIRISSKICCAEQRLHTGRSVIRELPKKKWPPFGQKLPGQTQLVRMSIRRTARLAAVQSIPPAQFSASAEVGSALWGKGGFKHKKPRKNRGLCKFTLASTYFPTQKYAVSWAMRRLTSEFGMGSGVPASPWTPRKHRKYIIDRDEEVL